MIAMFRAAIEGIKKRGNADVGDKTLLDALVPAVDRLEKAFNEGKDTPTALDEAAVVARECAEATRPMIAKKRPGCLYGRAQHWNVGCRCRCDGCPV